MKVGWEAKPLGEVCTIKPPKAEARAKLADGDEVSFAPMEDLGIGVKYLQPLRTRRLGEVSGSYTYFADGDVLLAKITPCFENGKLGVARGLTNGVGFGSSEYIVLRPSPILDAEFFYYYLARPTFLEEGARTMTGAVGHKRVTKEFIESYPIPLPPLAEQRRIVAILDEAFEGIATAKANAEKNLQNARELFASYVKSTFSTPVDGWVECALGSVCEMYQPKTITGKDLVADGPYPVYGANGVIGRYTPYNHEEAEVLVTCRGATCGAINVSEPKSWVTGNAMVVRPLDGSLDRSFLEHLLRNGVDLSPAITGAAQPQITRTNLSPLMISFPKSINEQRNLAASFDELQSAADSLRDGYAKKLATFDELQKSLLHQAFSGAL